MPWHIENDNADCSGFAVVKDDDGDVEGCHDTREEAEAQMAALYASEEKMNDEIKTEQQTLFDLESSCPKKAIKILDDDTRRIGAYATVWGELDCDNDRMTSQAIAPYLGKGAPYMFWLHGLDGEFKANPVGQWDATSFKIDPTGLYVEGNVSRDAHGDKAWQRIDQAGSFGLSVGSLWYLVKREKKDDGSREIVDWPLLEISLMEGGKQCVPSAQRNLKGDVEIAYRSAALKFGIETGHTDSGGPVKETQLESSKGEFKMDPNELNDIVAAGIAAEMQRRDQEAQAKADQDAKIKAEAERLAGEQTEKLKAEHEAELEKVKAEAQKKQPSKPVVSEKPETKIPQITLVSPYDRLSTMDLAVRYEMMKSYGKQPSQQMFNALGDRVRKLSSQEDTLYIKNGQPHRVPAIDTTIFPTRDLFIHEADGELFASKVGPHDRYTAASLDSVSDVVTPRGVAQFVRLANGGIKANELVYSTQASGGDEWVPTLMAAELWRQIRLNAAVLTLLEQFDMPSQPFDYPNESTDPTFYYATESTDETALALGANQPIPDSKIGTAKTTYSARKLAAFTAWSEEMEEDAIIAFEPAMRDQYGMAFAHNIDDVIINGDETTGTTNINSDGATIGTTSRYLALDGLRHEGLIVTSADSFDAATLAFADFTNARSLMGTGGKFGVNPNDLAYIMDPSTYYKTLTLTEVVTLEVFGSAATVLTGQLAAIGGVPVIVSEDLPLTDATGMVDMTAANNTQGTLICINRRGIKVGWRRRPRLRVVGLPGAEARYIVGSARLDLGFHTTGMVAVGYGVDV